MRAGVAALSCALAAAVLGCAEPPVVPPLDAGRYDFRASTRPKPDADAFTPTLESREYDVAVLQEVIACVDADAGGEPATASSAALALCGCLARVSDAKLEPVDLIAILGPSGAVSRVVVGPQTPLARCIESGLRGAKFPAPPSAPWKLALSLHGPG